MYKYLTLKVCALMDNLSLELMGMSLKKLIINKIDLIL